MVQYATFMRLQPLGWRHREWVWLAIVAVILLARFPIHFWAEPPYLMDFDVYRTIAQRIASGHAADLYRPTTSEMMVFKYGPCWALLWLPLAWLPGLVGAMVWSSLTTLWLVVACWASARLSERAGWPSPAWAAAAVALLLSRPIGAEFLNGQVDVLWGLLVIGFFLAPQGWLGALSLALAVSLKLPAALVPVYLLCRRRWRPALQCALLVLLLNGLAALVLHPANPLALFRDWTEVLSSSGPARAFEIGNQSLLALAGRFLSADVHQLNIGTLTPLTLVVIVGTVSMVLFAMVCAPRLRSMPDDVRLVVDGGLLTVLMVLCSPTAWIATYSALVLPVTLALSAAVAQCGPATGQACLRGNRAGGWGVDWMCATIAGALLVLSLMTHSTFWKALGIRHIRGETYVFLVLMILPWFALALWAFVWRLRSLSGYGRSSGGLA